MIYSKEATIKNSGNNKQTASAVKDSSIADSRCITSMGLPGESSYNMMSFCSLLLFILLVMHSFDVFRAKIARL